MSLLRRTIKENLDTVVQGGGLKGRVLRGGVWLGGGSFVEQAIRFARNMLLTRLLAPEAFGAMAIVNSATTLIQMAVDVGAREALIQNPKGGEDSHVTAAWWMTMARSFFIYCLVYLLAPEISHFYGNAELSSLARVVTLSILFDGAISPRAYIAIKEMKFRKWAVVNNGGGILGVITTIILSFFMRDVWALAIGFCSESAFRCILSYIVCPYVPRIPHIDAIRDLLKFSKGLFGLSLLNLVFCRADIFVLGKLYPAAELGLYSMAIYLIQTPLSFLINVMSQTLLPALSGVQDDDARMNRILLQTTSATVWLGLPVAVFVIFCGRSLLSIVYGPRYGAASAALAFTACAALFNVLNSQITLAFYAKGLPQLHRRSVASMAIAMVLLVYPLAKIFGLWGAQFACLMAVIVGYAFQVERIRKVTGLKISDYADVFPIPVFTSIGITALWLLITRYTSVTSRPIPNIVIGLGGCLLAYALAGAFFLRFRQAGKAA
jgi:O-antigen/teichoic acid export membrane protein